MTIRQSNFIILAILGTYILYRTLNPAAPEDSISNTIFSVSIELVGGIILFWILQFLQNINQLGFFVQTQLLYRNKEIRLSVAYLYRIKVNGKYLLVKSRNRNLYQPVGGVFKTLPGSEKVFEKLKVKSDRLIQTDHGIAKGDLRVYVKGINVIEFIEWFNSKEDREISPWREFCEELVTTGILNHPEFRYIDYKYIKTIQTPIIRLQTNELGIFIHEIYDLIPNDEQKAILERKLNAGDTNEYIWADEYLINRLGHDERSKTYTHDIALHTKWALNLKYSKA